MVDQLSLRLLGREVGDRAHNQPGLCKKPCREIFLFRRRALRCCTWKDLCDTKVKDLEPLIAGDHDVGGFQIPMNDTLLMGRPNRVEQLQGEIDEALLWHTTPGH